MSGNTDKLSKALAETSPHDIVAFAQTVGRQAKTVDGKVCGKNVGQPWHGWWVSKTGYVNDDVGRWSCVDTPGVTTHGWSSGPRRTLSERFGNLKWHDTKVEPIAKIGTGRGWPGTAEGKINTAQGMAGDLVSNLDSDEKATIAGILTRTVSGGEVLELRAVTTTSIMLNACYDFRSDPTRVVYPFGCVGLGTSLVSIADGHLTAKLAYKVKVEHSPDIIK